MSVRMIQNRTQPNKKRPLRLQEALVPNLFKGSVPANLWVWRCSLLAMTSTSMNQEWLILTYIHNCQTTNSGGFQRFLYEIYIRSRLYCSLCAISGIDFVYMLQSGIKKMKIWNPKVTIAFLKVGTKWVMIILKIRCHLRTFTMKYCWP